MRLALVLAIAGSASSCVAISAMQPASTVGKGNFQGGVEGTGLVVAVSGALGGTSGATGGALPTVNGFFRFGLSDNVDLGVRGGATLLEFQSKFMFTDSASRLVFSLAPALTGYFGAASSGTAMLPASPARGRLTFAVPLMFGIKFGDHELVFAGRATNHLLFMRPIGSPQLLNIWYQVDLGLSAGFAIRLGNSFILMPEVAVLAPVFASRAGYVETGTVYPPGTVSVTVGVAAIFGRMRPRIGAPPPEAPKPDEEQWEETKPSPPGAVKDSELPPDVAPPPPPPPQQ